MSTTTEFHFSPRANRASEINWMPWGAEAFSRAAAEDKPILLSISAVWCHWCHVMDETSYSDPAVIATINDRFIPVRVDNDHRPDINARYNMGGWPTTAFLAPDGTTLTGATYLAPPQMLRALEDVASFYAQQRDEIADRSAQLRTRRTNYTPSAPEDLRGEMVDEIADQLVHAFDEDFAGFGDSPKFPQPDALEFLLSEWRRSGNERLHEIVARTMLAMARGGMYDHIEGGFFRYSTTRDWSVPHFEKMAEDHAGLLRVLAQLVTWGDNAEFRATLVSATRYVNAVLRDSQSTLFAGSQDADEAYYELDLAGRSAHGAPYVDRTSYTNWSCGLAGAFALAGLALEDDALIAASLATLDTVHERLLDADGLAYHVLEPGGSPKVRGLLTDQAAYLRAMLDAHEVSGESRFLERARALADRIVERFGADDGGFYDHAKIEETIGRLDMEDRPIGDNGTLADSFLRLATLIEEPRYREIAQSTLTLYARTYAGAGSFAATYVRALRRLLDPEVAIKLHGSIEQTEPFRETARRLPSPFVTVRTLAGGDAPRAFVCVGTTCAAPVTSAADLRAAYDGAAG